MSRVYCHPFKEDWPEDPEILEQIPVTACHRRGAAIDLVLDRPRLSRSQFVFTEVKGHPAVFWQTQKTARTANPGARVPRRRPMAEGFSIAIDTRERYPFRFAKRKVETMRVALPAGATRSTVKMALSSRRWSARAWRTWPPRFRTERLPSSCNGWPSSLWRPWSLSEVLGVVQA